MATQPQAETCPLCGARVPTRSRTSAGRIRAVNRHLEKDCLGE